MYVDAGERKLGELVSDQTTTKIQIAANFIIVQVSYFLVALCSTYDACLPHFSQDVSYRPMEMCESRFWFWLASIFEIFRILRFCYNPNSK